MRSPVNTIKVRSLEPEVTSHECHSIHTGQKPYECNHHGQPFSKKKLYTSWHIRDFILEKILLNVINMEKPLTTIQLSIDTTMNFTQNRNSVNVLNVSNSPFLMYIRASVDVYYLQLSQTPAENRGTSQIKMTQISIGGTWKGFIQKCRCEESTGDGAVTQDPKPKRRWGSNG